ncbi:MAG: hypothetical protein WCC04_14080 [Terriglobales bacterium]
MKRKHFAITLSLAVLLCMTSAFAQTNYNFQAVNYPDDTFTQLLGINDSGIVAGYHNFTANQGFTYDVKTAKFTTENFSSSMQTQVIGINTGGETSGFYVSSSGVTEGFTDRLGKFTSVNYPGTPFNQLLSQNNYSQAAGYYSTSASGVPDVPYIYNELGGVFEVITIPNSTSAQATGINDSGEVCGFTIDTKNKMHGWLLIQGQFTQFDDPHGKGTTAALGLNNKGQVVGSYTDTSGNGHGFVYTVSSHSFETIDDPLGIGTTVVNGINDDGVLVGFWGTNPNNYGFVATPATP